MMHRTPLSFQLSVYGDSLQHNLSQILQTLVEIGYSYGVVPPRLLEQLSIQTITRSFMDTGIEPVLMFSQTPNENVSGDSNNVRVAGLERLRRLIETGYELGARRITGLAYGIMGEKDVLPRSERWYYAAEHVAEASEFAKEAGIHPSIEVLNRYETSMINTAADALEFVLFGSSNNLSIHLDTFHMEIEESDMVGALKSIAPKLAYLELGQSGRGKLSQGNQDFVRILTAFQRYTSNCLIGVEAFSRTALSDAASNQLCIWRTPFNSGDEVAHDAMAVIQPLLSTSQQAAST